MFFKKSNFEAKFLTILEDFATENYTNPFTELARIKTTAKDLLKTHKKGKKNDRNNQQTLFNRP